jgi:hypothetical protein
MDRELDLRVHDDVAPDSGPYFGVHSVRKQFLFIFGKAYACIFGK